jgi:hypothetical protein
MFELKLIQKSFVILFSLLLLIQCDTSATVQNQETEQPKDVENSTGTAPDEPFDVAEIISISPDYRIEKTGLEYLQTLPAPVIVYKIEKKQIKASELPDEFEEIVVRHWKESIRFSYGESFDKPKSAQEGFDRDLAWTKFCQETVSKLKEIEIEAGTRKRKISDAEASRTMGFLNQKASDLIQKVKTLKTV